MHFFFFLTSLSQPSAFSLKALEVIEKNFPCYFWDRNLLKAIHPSLSPSLLNEVTTALFWSLCPAIVLVTGTFHQIPAQASSTPRLQAFHSFYTAPARLHPFSQKSSVNFALPLPHFKKVIQLQCICICNQGDKINGDKQEMWFLAEM